MSDMTAMISWEDKVTKVVHASTGIMVKVYETPRGIRNESLYV